jgi:hypothetical protein
MFARGNVNFTGRLAAPAGFPLVLWPFTFHVGDSASEPMDLTGKGVAFRLYASNGSAALTLLPGSGLTVNATEGRITGTSQGIAHAPIAVGTYAYDLTIYEADGAPLRQVYGYWQFVAVPSQPPPVDER